MLSKSFDNVVCNIRFVNLLSMCFCSIDKYKYKMLNCKSIKYHSLLLLLFVWGFSFVGNIASAQEGVPAKTDSTAVVAKADSAAVTSEPAPAAGGAGGLSTDATVIANGKKLFDGNCAQCHAVAKKMVGPALNNVYNRQSVAWLINFIKYPQKTSQTDAYAAELFKQYAPQMMPNHDFFKDEEIVSILSWIKAETDNPTGPVVVNGGGSTSTASSEDNSSMLTVITIALTSLLVLVLGTLAILISVLKKHLEQNKGKLNEEDIEVVNQKLNIRKFLTTQPMVTILTFVFIAVAGKGAMDGLFSIGLQQGYAPTQPIPFSHKLHAGYYQIDCKYCHTGVEKSKNANIPSANICMNCHNTIRNTSPNIQKIYEAIEQDKPIQWVRVHNLPDLAYFNHQQHVKVGGLACENCHGDVKNMEVVQQHSVLTMGWCVDCHRKTDVNSKGNEYYEKLVKLHGEDNKAPMKVEDIGGLECVKCHY